MLKFLHCADLHLDSPFKGLKYLPKPIFERIQNSTFRSFTHTVNLAIKEKVDFVVIAGDIYDGDSRSLRAQTYFRKELERLDKHGIRTFMVHGNHDHLEGSWIDIEWPESVHIFNGGAPSSVPFYQNGKLTAMLHGFSYEQRSVPENRVPLFPEKKDEAYHIGILHGNAEGHSDHEPYAPFKVVELLNKGYDYWALGHIHKRMELSQNPPVIYPGNIQGRNPKETGEKGCYIIDTKNRLRIFHETQDIIWKEEFIDLTGYSAMSEMIQTCIEVKENARIEGKGVLLKLIIEGNSSLFQEMTDERLLEDLMEALQDSEEEVSSFVYPFALVNQMKRSWNRDQLVNDGGFVGALLNKSSAYEDMPNTARELFLHKRARRYLKPFEPEEAEEIIKEAETLLLRFLLKD